MRDTVIDGNDGDIMYSLFTSMAILMRPSSVPLYFCTSFLIPAILRRELTTHSGLVRRTLIQPEQEVTELYICLIMSLPPHLRHTQTEDP